MIVVCKPEESKMWYDKLWQNTVDLFRSMDIRYVHLSAAPEILADLKVKSCDVEGMVTKTEEILRGRELLEPGRRAGKKTWNPCKRR